MSTAPAPQLHYAINGPELYLAVQGGATHQVSLAAEPLAGEFLAPRPPQPRVVLDLAACTHVDSTFAGWMLRLHRVLAQAGGRLLLSGCPAACRANLELLGLASMFEFQAGRARPYTRRISCDLAELDDEALRFLLAAHEDLAAINPHNERNFAPVLRGLRQGLDHGRQGLEPGG